MASIVNDGILIRCDASTEVGLGHVMRCLALGCALRDDGVRVEIAMHEASAAATSAMATNGFVLHALDEKSGRFDVDAGNSLIALMGERGIATILVDHYAADRDFFSTLAHHADLVAVIDDQANRRFDGVGWVLNPNAGVARRDYKINPGAEVLIGPEFALLRPEFLTVRTNQVESDHCPTIDARILIQFGGGDTHALCARTVRWLQGINQRCEIRCVMVGRDLPDDRLIQPGHHKLTVLRNVSSMSEHMQWADFSIGAGGSVCWELCCLGVAMIVGELSADQAGVVKELNNRGAAFSLGKWNQVDSVQFIEIVRRLIAEPHLRQRMSAVGKNLVDGRGALRASQSLMKRMTQPAGVVA